MALLVTQDYLRTEVRRRANMENETTFITNDEIDSYVNDCLNDLYDQLIDARGQKYYRKTFVITTVSGFDSYLLPDNFYQLESVDLTLSGTGANAQRVPMKPFMEEERDDYVAYPSITPATGAPLRYSLINQSIQFIPMPSGTYTVTLNYVPAFVPLSVDNLSFDGVSGWESKAIWEAVAYCLNKEDPADPAIQFALGEAAKVGRRIDAMKRGRDSNEPQRIRDVRRAPRSMLGRR